jgi:purine-binding chemotaxis protein CheW
MTDATATHVVVVASVGPRIVGILVDAVSDILTIDRKDIQPVPKVTTNGAEDFISGLVTISGRMVALLTLERMFGFDISDPEPGH